jgi:hypothetical protein
LTTKLLNTFNTGRKTMTHFTLASQQGLINAGAMYETYQDASCSKGFSLPTAVVMAGSVDITAWV